MTFQSSLRAQRGNPDYDSASELPRRCAPRNDEFLRAFAPSREPNLFLFSRKGAKARRDWNAADSLQLLRLTMPQVWG